MHIKWVGAHPNNYGAGRDGKTIKKVVMHWIVGTLASADASFANPNRRASAHYGVGPDEIHQYVKEEDTAWHAGNLDVNKESIGIEHQGGPDLPIDPRTILNSAELLAGICKRYNIPLDRNHIKLHREIKATQCPGTLDVDEIIDVAKEINNAPTEPLPISEPNAKIDFKGFKTDLETYEVLELQVVKAKLKAKDARIKELESQPSAPAFTKPIAKLHYQLAQEFEK
jgi:N-acetyl-anhydromuramyl-L-alanine amidase AmpD